MKHYLMTVHLPQDEEEAPPEVMEQLLGQLTELGAEMRAAGVWVFGGGLHDPDTAAVVRYEDDELSVTDGPYAEAKEHIGGFDIIKAPDLDAATVWAGKLSRIFGLPIEVRSFEPGV